MARTLFAVILLVLLPCSAAAQTASPPLYHYVDLGVLPGGGYSEAASINNSVQLVGYSTEASGNYHAFLYAAGGMTDLGTLGGTTSQAFGINDSGLIVGTAQDASGNTHAFLYSGGGMTDLGTLGGDYSDAYGINDSGQIVEYAYTSSNLMHAFLRQNGTMYDLNDFTVDLGAVTLDYASSINDLGQIVGVGDNNHAYLLSPPETRYDFTFYYDNGAGDAGQVVWFGYKYDGSLYSDFTIFLYQDGVLYQLAQNDAGFYTPAINDVGQVVYEDDIGTYNDIYLITPESYSGQVYAGADMPYYVGYTEAVPNETGLGYYVITG